VPIKRSPVIQSETLRTAIYVWNELHSVSLCHPKVTVMDIYFAFFVKFASALKQYVHISVAKQ
jgi:hypothetical protein